MTEQEIKEYKAKAGISVASEQAQVLAVIAAELCRIANALEAQNESDT